MTQSALPQCPLCFDYTAHISILECCLSPVCANCYHDVHNNNHCCLHLYKVDLISVPVSVSPVKPSLIELNKSKAQLAEELAHLQTIRRKTVKFYNKLSQEVVDIKLPQPLQYYQQADVKAVDKAIELVSTIQANQDTFGCLAPALPEFTFTYSVNYIIFDDAKTMIRLPPVWPDGIYAVFAKIFQADDLKKFYTLLLALAKNRTFTVVLTRPSEVATEPAKHGAAILNFLAAVYPLDHCRASVDILTQCSWHESIKALLRVVLVDLSQPIRDQWFNYNKFDSHYNRNLSQGIAGNSVRTENNRRVLILDHSCTTAASYDGPEAIRFKSSCSQEDLNFLTKPEFIQEFSEFLQSLRTA